MQPDGGSATDTHLQLKCLQRDRTPPLKREDAKSLHTHDYDSSIEHTETQTQAHIWYRRSPQWLGLHTENTRQVKKQKAEKDEDTVQQTNTNKRIPHSCNCAARPPPPPPLGSEHAPS
mmetsp:Transcript_42585/g.83965  ORF Transcript_42585/g.83965 Transcript_42585/m.83965 type:complete len:118 (+) Transcript_42585:649-1002(+)